LLVVGRKTASSGYKVLNFIHASINSVEWEFGPNTSLCYFK
jgi:hypothetical protein